MNEKLVNEPKPVRKFISKANFMSALSDNRYKRVTDPKHWDILENSKQTDILELLVVPGSALTVKDMKKVDQARFAELISP